MSHFLILKFIIIYQFLMEEWTHLCYKQNKVLDITLVSNRCRDLVSNWNVYGDCLFLTTCILSLDFRTDQIKWTISLIGKFQIGSLKIRYSVENNRCTWPKLDSNTYWILSWTNRKIPLENYWQCKIYLMECWAIEKCRFLKNYLMDNWSHIISITKII